MPKAIIEVVGPGAYLAAAQAAARRLDAGEDIPEADYHLGFATTAQLFDALSPSRMALLEAIQRMGPISLDALAERLERSATSVHSDADRLVEHELVSTDADGKLFVPWEQVHLRITLPAEQAA